MGIYNSQSEAAKSMAGVHLFHFFMSNCSQRVRFALEEKGVEWTSHHLNLPAREHLSEEYRAINPNAVVPTLVHEGQVVIESNDIISYVDEEFDGPQLGPRSDAEREAVSRLLQLSDDAQSAIKVLSHELLFKPVRQVTRDDVEAMEAEGARPELVEFMRDFSEDGKAWSRRVSVANEWMRNALITLDTGLNDTGPWLSGCHFGLADISWSVNAYRLMLAGLDTSDLPVYEGWRARVTERSAFQSAVVNFGPG